MLILDWFFRTFGATTVVAEPVHDPATDLRVIDVFVPVKDFFSDVFHSAYVQGLPYTIRYGNMRLYEHAHVWEQQGLVRFVGSGRDLTKARLQGKGKI